MHTPELLKQYPIISDQISRPALGVVLGQLEQILATGVEGDIVELGCYIGTTTLFMRRLLDIYGGKHILHAYDSFEGLPPKSSQDSNAAGVDFKAGELAVSKKQFLEQFKRAHLQPPITHKAWFNELTSHDLPNQIAFAFLDGDFYESILVSLQLVWPRLSKGGVITIDDYQREALPGVEKAVRDFLRGKPHQLQMQHNIAILKP